MEKKKAERERLKAEKERLKQEAKSQKEKDAKCKESPEPEEDIVDSLLKEIRAGTKLRTSTDTGRRPSRCILKKGDIEKLEHMKRENISGTIEDLVQEVNGEGIKEAKQCEQEDIEDDLEHGENAEKLKQMNQKNTDMATIAEDLASSEQMKQKLHQENGAMIIQNRVGQEVNVKDIENHEQMEQERLITAVKCLNQELSGKEAEKHEQMEQEGLTKRTTKVVDSLKQEVNGECIEGPKQLEIRKQENNAMMIEDIEQEENVVE